MTKPVFGKWSRLEEATPKNGQVVFFKVKGEALIGDYEITALNEELFTHSGVSYYAQEWMPLPKAGEDAFTELRTLLDNYERNASEGKLQQFDDGMLFVIKKIREVVE